MYHHKLYFIIYYTLLQSQDKDDELKCFEEESPVSFNP